MSLSTLNNYQTDECQFSYLHCMGSLNKLKTNIGLVTYDISVKWENLGEILNYLQDKYEKNDEYINVINNIEKLIKGRLLEIIVSNDEEEITNFLRKINWMEVKSNMTFGQPDLYYAIAKSELELCWDQLIELKMRYKYKYEKNILMIREINGKSPMMFDGYSNNVATMSFNHSKYDNIQLRFTDITYCNASFNEIVIDHLDCDSKENGWKKNNDKNGFKFPTFNIELGSQPMKEVSNATCRTKYITNVNGTGEFNVDTEGIKYQYKSYVECIDECESCDEGYRFKQNDLVKFYHIDKQTKTLYYTFMVELIVGNVPVMTFLVSEDKNKSNYYENYNENDTDTEIVFEGDNDLF